MYIDKNKETIKIGDKVEIEINNGIKIVGIVRTFPEERKGFDYISQQPIIAEYGWEIIGKIKDSEETIASWEIKLGQYKDIEKISS
ncbi:MAG: hypothetical protein PHQ18_01255 [Patescibacteria group bacterium]|nr:hypothetical protein [Patescibacteria group bacterium]